MSKTFSRLDNTLLYLLSIAQEKGKKNLSKFQLMKLIYMAEVESCRYSGKSFLGDARFIRHENGPISLDIYDSLKKLHPRYIHVEESQKKDYAYPRHGISLKRRVKINLSESEKIFLNSVFESYLNLSQQELKQLVYQTEPMREILKEERKQHIKLIGTRINFDLIPLDRDVVELISA